MGTADIAYSFFAIGTTLHGAYLVLYDDSVARLCDDAIYVAGGLWGGLCVPL